MSTTEDNIENAYDSTVTAVEQGADTAKATLDGKITELKGKAEEVYGKAKDGYAKASEKAKAWAPETAREAKERAARLAEESTAKVRQTVQEQPIAVLAGGVALGFVVGWLLSGRRN
jgi:ElaB/YqjD/DUF883 family membrane-anchored ribosome-binding protein